jgi:divalent metal cation (Fe/Co/Zn/Cd) transporter
MMQLLQQLAADIVKLKPGEAGIPQNSADSVLTSGLNLVYYFGGVACVIVIVVAGILYALSAGDSNQTKQAKNAILYAVVGLVVIMMAFVITSFVIGEGTK